MSAHLPNASITSDIKPSALFSQVTNCVASQCDAFGPNDYIFIQAGTNDMLSAQPNTSKRLVIPASLFVLSNKTNVVFCSIPYRYDKHGSLSTNICYTNIFFKYLYSRTKFHYLDTNSFMFRPLYTEEGLHFNMRGKRLLASKLVDFINYHVPNILSIPLLCSHCINVVSNTSTRDTSNRQVSTVGTQVRGYDIDSESDPTFGSISGDVVNHSIDGIINLSDENDDLLFSTNFSHPIPVISNHNARSNTKHSNFNPGVRTLIT